ncbi:MAG: hypothetical protein LBT37_04175 [Lactobacillaceae bacterium]|jgi:uncharacterized protein YlxW (UPF0749 family)|nr:hypothetical protein [Lactobacillaceae bacterium]
MNSENLTDIIGVASLVISGLFAFFKFTGTNNLSREGKVWEQVESLSEQNQALQKNFQDLVAENSILQEKLRATTNEVTTLKAQLIQMQNAMDNRQNNGGQYGSIN